MRWEGISGERYRYRVVDCEQHSLYVISQDVV